MYGELIIIAAFFVVVWLACGALWFIGPDKIRPPWLDWGLDKHNDEQDDSDAKKPQ